MSKNALDPQVRKLLQYIVSQLADTEPDWFLDPSTVIGHIYAEAVRLLHQEASPLPEELN